MLCCPNSLMKPSGCQAFSLWVMPLLKNVNVNITEPSIQFPWISVCVASRNSLMPKQKLFSFTHNYLAVFWYTEPSSTQHIKVFYYDRDILFVQGLSFGNVILFSSISNLLLRCEKHISLKSKWVTFTIMSSDNLNEVSFSCKPVIYITPDILLLCFLSMDNYEKMIFPNLKNSAIKSIIELCI